MNWFAEYLLNFSHCEASSCVQSQLAKHRKLKPRPGSDLNKAQVPQKIIWVDYQAAGDWFPFSVFPQGIIVRDQDQRKIAEHSDEGDRVETIMTQTSS